MSRTIACCGAFLSACLLAITTARAQEAGEKPAAEKPASELNLLRLKTAKIERSTAAIDEARRLAALTDDDLKTVAATSATAESPLDVVYGFGGAMVSAERIVIRLPARPPGEVGAGFVELLVSTVSPQAGFRSVRGDPLKPTTDPQEFKFRPVAAKWIMLRFTPWKEREEIAVAEVLVLGTEGPPATLYEFNQSPAKALDVLERLKTLSGVNVALSADEKSLVADAEDGKLDRLSLAEASLIASGVATAAARKKHLTRLDELEAQAKPIVAEGKTPFEKGEKLLGFLHREGILKKYHTDQTDLSTLLETGRYNCVSSAIVYAVLAKRFDLDVRAIEVPDHAFAILYDDTRHADVETTTPSGFNPSRDKKTLAEFEKLTGFRYIPDDRDERREVDEAGLVAIVWYNRGVDGTKQKRYGEALASYFRALCLDADSRSAVKNTLASLHNWSRTLAEEKKFEESLTVIGAALELAPANATFQNARDVAWEEFARWHVEAGRRDEALGVLRRAAQAVPQGDFAALETWVFIKPAEDLADKKDYAGALAVVTPALAKFEGKQRGEILDYQESVYSRWSMHEIEAKKWPDAAKILGQGVAALPESTHLAHNLAVVAQNWTKDVAKQEGAAKAEALILDLVKKHPQADRLKDVAANQLKVRIEDDLKAKKYTEALASVTRIAQVIDDKEVLEELQVYVWNAWGLDLAEAKKWAEALKVFGDGRKALPKNATLEKNERILWHQWTEEKLKAEDWPAAIKIFTEAQARFPKDDGLVNNEKYAWSKLGERQYEKKDFAAAAKTFADARKRYPDDEGFRQNELGSWFAQCEAAIEAKQWEKAVELHQQARERFPKEELLAGNERICWLNWAKLLADKKDWAGALKIMEQAVKRYPEDAQVQEHLKICRENAKKK